MWKFSESRRPLILGIFVFKKMGGVLLGERSQKVLEDSKVFSLRRANI